MNDFRKQMPELNIDPKKLVRYVIIGVSALILVILFLM